MSQEQLAEKMNVTRQSVSKWENGESYPEMNNILELCKIFNCKLNDLVHTDMSDFSSLDEEIVMSVVKFNEKKQKEMKTLSNAIGIIGKIGAIVLKVSIPFVIVAMLMVPYVVSNLEIKENEISFASESIKIVDENKVEINGVIVAGYDGELTNNEVVYMMTHYSKIELICYFELAIVSLLVVIVIMMVIFTCVEKLFHNIKNELTPFTLDNVKYIKKISYLMIALIVFTPISSAIMSLVSGSPSGEFNGIMGVLEILIIFSMSYIFEYGYEIQKDSNGKIYSE